MRIVSVHSVNWLKFVSCNILFYCVFHYSVNVCAHSTHYSCCLPSVLTLGSKQPNSGLRKPQMSGIPSGIQRAAPGLRPPSARSNAPASSSTDTLRGPTGTHTVVRLCALTVYSDIQSQIWEINVHKCDRSEFKLCIAVHTYGIPIQLYFLAPIINM